MDGNKTIPALFLMIALFGFYLHIQGKLVPILAAIFGSAGDPLHVNTTSPAAQAATPATNTSGMTLLQILQQATVTAINAQHPATTGATQ